MSRDSSCPKYQECLDKAAKENFSFNCKICKERGGMPEFVAARDVPETFKPKGRGFSGSRLVGTPKRLPERNECTDCSWRDRCANAIPECFKLKS